MGGWVGILQLLFGSEGLVVDFSTFILFLNRLFGFTSFFRCKNGHFFLILYTFFIFWVGSVVPHASTQLNLRERYQTFSLKQIVFFC